MSQQDLISVDTHTQKSLPMAIGHLLEVNNYNVEYSLHVHGAEVDIVATPKSDPFSQKIFIEATVEYVDTAKYGKDTTKFILLREKFPDALMIVVSTKGFTSEVKERAAASRVRTETYDELFRRFEKFSDYISHINSNSIIQNLVQRYEPPTLSDSTGVNDAISWFNDWIFRPEKNKWVVLLGEYGTGKTALTQYLQSTWLNCYAADAKHPVPIRIELRDFTRQFDARSLLHHFLDSNQLSHVSLDFLLHLIRVGRVVLLLDGYDEMAQFMNARERRACLSALAQLANDGAFGVLTSRPNYFTESEELTVFDALYATLEKNKYFIGAADRTLIEEERRIDSLLGKYVLGKKERYLRDLDATQTISLVKRKLEGDEEGQQVILDILSRVFRDEQHGARQSLSGKPVIVSYLLELIEDLKVEGEQDDQRQISEWYIYKMIVDRLMMRDFRRSPSIDPGLRRESLRKIALRLSQKSTISATEEDFFQTIDDVFKTNLRILHGEEKRSRRDELFQDLRSSATLTRREMSGAASGDSWQFSHNSLREYLVSETIIDAIHAEQIFRSRIPVSDAMRAFAASMGNEESEKVIARLQELWPHRDESPINVFISFFWEAMRLRPQGLVGSLSEIARVTEKETINLSGLSLDRVTLSKNDCRNGKIRLLGERSHLSNSLISDLDMSGSSLSMGTIDSVTFSDVNLSNVDFRGSLLFECGFRNVSINGADFRNIEDGSNVVAWKESGSFEILSDKELLGYLRFHGALTDDVEDFFVAKHHEKFSIVMKICENIAEQKKSQHRGLTQRGAAHADPVFARSFVSFMQRRGYIDIDRHDLVSATPEGRRVIPPFIDSMEVFDGLMDFLEFDSSSRVH